MREGPRSFDNIRKFLRYLLSLNICEVLTVFMGVVGGGVIGLTSQGAGGSPAVLPRSRSALLQVAVVRLPWLNLAFSTVPRGAVVQ